MELIIKFMKIETVGNLRKLVDDNNGAFRIGTLSFANNDGDIDVRHRGDIVMWFSSELKDENSLIGTESVTGIFYEKESDFCEPDPQEEINKLKSEIVTLKQSVKDCGLNAGKVVAYENILLGRDLTIGK